MPVNTLVAFPFGASAATFPQHSLLPSSHTVPTTPLFDGADFDFFGTMPDDDAPVASSSSDSSIISVPRYDREETSDQDEKPTKVARPPNAWILYRSTKLAEFKEQNPEIYTGGKRSKADRGLRPTQANMSKQIGEMWAKEPASVKDYFHREAMLRSVMHAVENPGTLNQYVVARKHMLTCSRPGYRFNPNKGRKVKSSSIKSRSPAKSPRRPITGSSTPVSDGPSPARRAIPSSAPAVGGAFQLSVLGPETMNSWAAQASPAASQGPSSLSMTTSPSLLSQLDVIFPNDQQQVSYPASSAGSSYQSSPPWTGGLMPALSIGEAAASSSCTSPTTPLSEFDGVAYSDCTGLPIEQYTQYAVHPAHSFPASPYTFPQLQPASVMQPVAIAAPEIDWWQFRDLKVRLDDNGIPLEELLLNLQSQQQQEPQEQQYYIRQQ